MSSTFLSVQSASSDQSHARSASGGVIKLCQSEPLRVNSTESKSVTSRPSSHNGTKSDSTTATASVVAPAASTNSTYMSMNSATKEDDSDLCDVDLYHTIELFSRADISSSATDENNPNSNQNPNQRTTKSTAATPITNSSCHINCNGININTRNNTSHRTGCTSSSGSSHVTRQPAPGTLPPNTTPYCIKCAQKIAERLRRAHTTSVFTTTCQSNTLPAANGVSCTVVMSGHSCCPPDLYCRSCALKHGICALCSTNLTPAQRTTTQQLEELQQRARRQPMLYRPRPHKGAKHVSS